MMLPRPCWRAIRRWWHMRLRRLTREAAEDLLDGLDLGDHDVGRPSHPPPSPTRLARLDRNFRAGGPVADRVARRLAADLYRRQ